MADYESRCRACQFMRKKCIEGCIYAPHFCRKGSKKDFAAIHGVFGCSNVSKILAQLPVSDHREAILSLVYEAQARLQDPVHGCVFNIFSLHQQVAELRARLASSEEARVVLQQEVANLRARVASSESQLALHQQIVDLQARLALSEEIRIANLYANSQSVQNQLFPESSSNPISDLNPNFGGNFEHTLYGEYGSLLRGEPNSIENFGNPNIPEENSSFASLPQYPVDLSSFNQSHLGQLFAWNGQTTDAPALPCPGEPSLCPETAMPSPEMPAR